MFQVKYFKKNVYDLFEIKTFRMELATRYYDPQQYIETANANKVSRVALLCGSQNIKLQGKVRLST
jgi:hypothetical protein